MSESLTEFLLARIAEDERMWKLAETAELAFTTRSEGVAAVPPENFARRMVAECEAKRRIVVLHGKPHRCRMWDFEGVTDRRDPCDTLRALALPYADHDDYREEWKP